MGMSCSVSWRLFLRSGNAPERWIWRLRFWNSASARSDDHDHLNRLAAGELAKFLIMILRGKDFDHTASITWSWVWFIDSLQLFPDFSRETGGAEMQITRTAASNENARWSIHPLDGLTFNTPHVADSVHRYLKDKHFCIGIIRSSERNILPQQRRTIL